MTSIQEWSDNLRNGMSDERLSDVFDLVKPEGNWKLPIEARVPAGAAGSREIATAIDYFAGGGATIEAVMNPDTGQVHSWLVTAPGYYSQIGA